MKIRKQFNKEKGWFDYEPAVITMICIKCGYKVDCVTWQIIEKEYHVSGKIFCPHCHGKIKPIEKLEVINNNYSLRCMDMEKITILGKEDKPKFPEEFPVDDFNTFIETYTRYPHLDSEIDYFDLMGEFHAFLFMKYNKDLFVKMMVEEAIKLHREGIRCWFEKNMPI